MCHTGEGGLEDDPKAAYYISLHTSIRQYPDNNAGCMLGRTFYHGLWGLDKSLYRAKFEEAAEKGNEDTYITSLALTLHQLCRV